MMAANLPIITKRFPAKCRDPSTDVVRDAELFVGVLGASSYTYAEATFTQTLADWIGSRVRMFRFFGGVPRLVVPERPVRSRVHGAPAAASSTAHADSRGPWPCRKPTLCPAAIWSHSHPEL